MVNTKKGHNTSAASSSSHVRSTGRPPRSRNPVTREEPTGGVDDLAARSGPAPVMVPPGEYARFQAFQQLSPEEWQQFQLFQQFRGMQGFPMPGAMPMPTAAGTSHDPPLQPRAEVELAQSSGTRCQLFEMFLKIGPCSFSGSTDPLEAANWLREMNQILRRIECPVEIRVSLVTFVLKDAAGYWWEGVERKYEARGKEVTWDEFMMEFENRYITAHAQTEKRTEMLALTQGSMTITEYEAKFYELSRFAPELVATEEGKIYYFQRGLKSELMVHLSGHTFRTLADAAEKVKCVEAALGRTGQKRTQEGFSWGRSETKGKQKKSSSTSAGVVSPPRPALTCNRCEGQHSRGYRCDGTPFTCYACGKEGYLASRCWSRGGQQ